MKTKGILSNKMYKTLLFKKNIKKNKKSAAPLIRDRLPPKGKKEAHPQQNDIQILNDMTTGSVSKSLIGLTKLVLIIIKKFPLSASSRLLYFASPVLFLRAAALRERRTEARVSSRMKMRAREKAEDMANRIQETMRKLYFCSTKPNIVGPRPVEANAAN